MKNFILVLVASLMALVTVESQAASDKKVIVEVKFQVSVDCDHCVKKVMNFMPFQKGIKDVVVDLDSKSATISYDTSKSSSESIIKLFKKIDIEASVIEPEVEEDTTESEECEVAIY